MERDFYDKPKKRYQTEVGCPRAPAREPPCLGLLGGGGGLGESRGRGAKTRSKARGSYGASAMN